MAPVTEVLQCWGRGSLRKIGWEDAEGELPFMGERGWSARSSAWGWMRSQLRACGLGLERTGQGDFIVGIICCTPPDQEEEMDEALYRQIGAASCSQALVVMEDFIHSSVCWRDNTAGHKQSRRFLESIDNSLFLQMTEDTVRKGALLDFLLSNKEGLVGDVNVKGGLGGSEHEMVEFRSLRAGKRVKSKVTLAESRLWPPQRSAWKG